MSLSAIPEETSSCLVDMRCNSLGSHAQHTDQLFVNIKHTFIELAAKPQHVTRMRSFTDSELLSAESGPVFQELSDTSTDAPSDAEDVAEVTKYEEWASPCWGPAGDLFYSGDMLSDLQLSPAADVVNNPWAVWQDYSAWMQMCSVEPNLVDPVQLEQWQRCSGFEASYGNRPDTVAGNSQPRAGKPLWSDLSLDVCSMDAPPKTTIMLRNLPSNFTRSDLVVILEDEGFEGSYDVVYVPMDFSCECSLGYAFVNFMSEGDAARCWSTFDGFSAWGVPSEKECEVMWSDPQQGADALIERYRNSPVMHESMPAEWKPAYFVNGVQLPFPAPTITIKAPKQKKARSKAKKEKQ